MKSQGSKFLTWYNARGEREVGNSVTTMRKGIIFCSWVERMLAEVYERPPPGVGLFQSGSMKGSPG